LIFKLEEITWMELDSLDRERTLLMIPISPLEEHGPHLPIGTDIMAAADIAEQAAMQLSDKAPGHAFVRCPAVPLGCAGITADFPGTISLRGSTLKNVVVDICRAFVDHGFKYLLFCNHHLDPIHMKAILWAIEEVKAEHTVHIAETMSRSVYAGLENEAVAHGQAMGLDMRFEIHADAKEAAYIRYRRPDLYKPDAAPLDPVRIDVRKGMQAGHTTFKQMGAELGYIGSPATSDTDFGRLHIEACIRQAVALALKLIRGESLPPIDPKMWAFLDKLVKLD
jgi:creatinine amidohydrolase